MKTDEKINETTNKNHPSVRLAENRRRLITDFHHRKADHFTKQLTLSMDEYIRENFEKSAARDAIEKKNGPLAVAALGGYGRNELCVGSDVDILFLFEGSVPEEADGLVRDIVLPLWDLGIDVGHSTRTADDCMVISAENMEDLTALLDARYVCGSSALLSNFRDRFRKEVVRPRSGEFMDRLIQTNRDRHRRFGDSSFLLEPNLKEGRGGLRDYHTMLWIAKIKYGLEHPRDLEYNGCLSHDEYKIMAKALSFVRFVRNRLHTLSRKKNDRLDFASQEKIADELNFKAVNGQYPVERFLGRLHKQMNFIKVQHEMLLHELQTASAQKGKTEGSEKTGVDGIRIKKEMLGFESSEQIIKSPELLIRIFEEAAKRDLPLNHEARRLVRHFGYLVDDGFRSSDSARESFEQILSAPINRFNVLNEMLETGFLTRYIPEFKGIADRIQYDEYHVYPVDKHSIMTVRNLKRFGADAQDGEDPYPHDVFTEIKHKTPLFWAGLLHDIGKSESGGGHSEKGAEIVGGILKRKGYGTADSETVSFLVREHLLLVKAATRRDINDEETSIACARRIRDPERLKMLYLLSAADSMATGPKAWNNWISALVKELFVKIGGILEKDELASARAVASAEKKREDVVGAAETPEERRNLESLFMIMSPRYLLYTPAPEIRSHIRIFKTLGRSDFVWDITPSPDGGTREVVICAKDAPGLISKIAGVFTLNGIDILNVRVFTWRNNIALDIFDVKPPPDKIYESEKWDRAAKHLASALSGDLDLAVALNGKMAGLRTHIPGSSERPPKVVVDNDSSGFFTIVEVFAYDFQGLLYRITDALFRCGLDIWVAKIATHVDQVVDVFYVRDFDGQKVDTPEQIAGIQNAVERVLTDFPTSGS